MTCKDCIHYAACQMHIEHSIYNCPANCDCFERHYTLKEEQYLKIAICILSHFALKGLGKELHRISRHCRFAPNDKKAKIKLEKIKGLYERTKKLRDEAKEVMLNEHT